VKSFDPVTPARLRAPDLRARAGRHALALLPVLLALLWQGDFGLPLRLAAAALAALLLDALLLGLRGQSIRAGARAAGGLLPAALSVLCLGPGASLPACIIAACIVVVVGRHLYGGPGRAPFNPVMLGWAVILLTMPSASAWPQGDDWLPVSLACAVGGLILIGWRLIAWQTPLLLLAGAAILAGVLLVGGDAVALAQAARAPEVALFALAICFVASDPASSCVSRRGRWLFAVGLVALALSACLLGARADQSLAFSTLLLNALAPWLDSAAPQRDQPP